jgi:hypothetical protein
VSSQCGQHPHANALARQCRDEGSTARMAGRSVDAGTAIDGIERLQSGLAENAERFCVRNSSLRGSARLMTCGGVDVADVFDPQRGYLANPHPSPMGHQQHEPVAGPVSTTGEPFHDPRSSRGMSVFACATAVVPKSNVSLPP